MFNCIAAKKVEDYFLPSNKRPSQTVYFYRIIGYNKESLDFLSHYYYETKQNGIYQKTTMRNPEENEVKTYFQVVGQDFQNQKEFFDKALQKWLPKLEKNQRELLKEAIFVQLDRLEKKGSNLNILKNICVKFFCWLRYIFEKVAYQLGNIKIPKILYEGEISRHELYFLQVLAWTGCDVLLVNFKSDDEYKKIDPNSEYTKVIYYSNVGIPTTHFTKVDWEKKVQVETVDTKYKAFEDVLNTNTWMKEDFFVESLKILKERSTTSSQICNLFVAYFGIDKQGEYENRLFYWKQKLEKKKKYILVEKRIENPTVDEVNKIVKPVYHTTKELIYSLSELIQISKDKTINSLVKKAFIEMMQLEEDSNLGKLCNRGISMLCWLSRYGITLFAEARHDTIPIFIFYGSCNYNEQFFLRMLAKTPVDVVIFCPDLNEKGNITDNHLTCIVLENSMPITQFPKAEKRIQATTVAYQAEQELNTILYQDTGLFRNRQFLKSMPVTLKTTYEEIDLLWKEESKYRPSFQSSEERVMVPTIFAKISGVKEEDLKTYWQSIENKLTEDTILIQKVPFLDEDRENKIKSYVSEFYKNGKLQINKIKTHSSYLYDYLAENVQDYILDKIQELIELKWIKSEKSDIAYTILSVLLSLDKTAIRMIQKFDFTKEIPKLIVINTKETMCSLEESIYITFFNLVGFDILLFVPTGYRIIEKYLKQEIFEEHIIGEYMFDLAAPVFRVKPKPTGRNVFNKLFGRGWN